MTYVAPMELGDYAQSDSINMPRLRRSAMRYSPAESSLPALPGLRMNVEAFSLLQKQKSTARHRWWTYQRERFPIFAHGALITAFSFSAVSYSALLRGATRYPGL